MPLMSSVRHQGQTTPDKATASTLAPELPNPRSIRASKTGKNIAITQIELGQLEQLCSHLNRRHVERTAPAVKSASASRSQISSKNGT